MSRLETGSTSPSKKTSGGNPGKPQSRPKDLWISGRSPRARMLTRLISMLSRPTFCAIFQRTFTRSFSSECFFVINSKLTNAKPNATTLCLHEWLKMIAEVGWLRLREEGRNTTTACMPFQSLSPWVSKPCHCTADAVHIDHPRNPRNGPSESITVHQSLLESINSKLQALTPTGGSRYRTPSSNEQANCKRLPTPPRQPGWPNAGVAFAMVRGGVQGQGLKG